MWVLIHILLPISYEIFGQVMETLGFIFLIYKLESMSLPGILKDFQCSHSMSTCVLFIRHQSAKL